VCRRWAASSTDVPLCRPHMSNVAVPAFEFSLVTMVRLSFEAHSRGLFRVGGCPLPADLRLILSEWVIYPIQTDNATVQDIRLMSRRWADRSWMLHRGCWRFCGVPPNVDPAARLHIGHSSRQ
jgi:hypothetical protein